MYFLKEDTITNMYFMFREFTWKDWILSVVFALLVVFATNNIAIRGGCSYSACSALDGFSSYGVDYYFSADTLGLTPTGWIGEHVL